MFGVWGSYICVLISVLALIGQFYVALYPVGGPYLDASIFFELYLAGPLVIFLYLVWKVYSWFYRPADRPFFIPLDKIDVYTGMREGQNTISGLHVGDEERRASINELQDEKAKKGAMGYLKAGVRNLI